MKSGQTQTLQTCAHCGDPCSAGGPSLGDMAFCCEGCKTVYGILQQHDLCDYYALNAHPGVNQRRRFRQDKFAFLDQPEIAARLIRFTDGQQTHLTFYLPQMHCSSCLWLLEHVRRINPGILSSRVDFTAKEIHLILDNTETTIRQAVETLAGIGYEPHLSLEDVTARSLRGLDRTRWYKIGVAGFSFSNIMMLSFPEYLAGEGAVEPAVARTLSFISIGLSLPVIGYAAQEFFANAWAGLKNRYLNIDAPVALALVITFGRSLYEILSGTGPGYLDSLSGIVFFMLIGRWLQDKTYRTISFDRDYRSFFPIAVDVVRPDGVVSCPIQDLKVNDVMRIHHDELIPADAIVSKGHASIDYSFVTGESVPVAVEKGEIAYAGGRQTEGILELVVVKEVSQSYLTGLWNRVRETSDFTASPRFVDTLSRYFTYVVFVIAALAAAWWQWQGQPTLMWNALTTILIVACPCALLLAANFTRGNIVRILAREKFYLKNADVLERLASADHIVWDKTGTLTANQRMEVAYAGDPLTTRQKQQIAGLLVHSTHPLSRAVLRELAVDTPDPATHFKVVPGQGIEGWVDDLHIKIGSPAFTHTRTAGPAGSLVSISIDQRPVGVFTVRNQYRPGIFSVLQRLKKNYTLSVLSGDNDSEADTLRHHLGNDIALAFNQSPTNKLDDVRRLQTTEGHKVIMVGDGLNDAGALQESTVGIAISEADNPFTPAADAILHASSLPNLDRMLAFVRESKRIIMFTFAVSIVYNVVGLYFAVQGILSPLIAAILMPSSSLTIIAITFGLTQYKARRLREDSSAEETKSTAGSPSSGYPSFNPKPITPNP